MTLSRRAFLFGKTAALPLPSAEEPPPEAWPVEIGEQCLAFRGVVCRGCGELCETGAIRFVLRPGGVAQPLLDSQRCTGCGDCLGDCPVQAIHRLAPSHSPSLRGEA